MQIIRNIDISTHAVILAHAVVAFQKMTSGVLAVFLDNMTVSLLDAPLKFEHNTENIMHIYL